jgi:hypothetical protein
VQMEKELNHVPRREIDRSVEVLHFVAGEDSSRRVLCLWRPQHRGAPVQRTSTLPAVAPATAVQFLTCFSV